MSAARDGTAVEEVAGDAVVGLDMSRRGLADLSPWLGGGALRSLETLDCSRNVLASLRGVAALPRLRVLNLYFNRVEALGELLRLAPCAASLTVLDLRLNPVTRIEGYRRCAVAARRGVSCAVLR